VLDHLLTASTSPCCSTLPSAIRRCRRRDQLIARPAGGMPVERHAKAARQDLCERSGVALAIVDECRLMNVTVPSGSKRMPPISLWAAPSPPDSADRDAAQLAALLLSRLRPAKPFQSAVQARLGIRSGNRRIVGLVGSRGVWISLRLMRCGGAIRADRCPFPPASIRRSMK